MTDEDSIRNLLARYWLYLDDRQADDWAALFEETARIEIGGTVTEGMPAIRKVANDFAQFTWSGCHVGSNIDITVDQSDTAHATSDVVFLLPDGVSLLEGEIDTSGTRVMYTARCRDRLRKVGGQWRFAERLMEVRIGAHP